MSTTKTKNKHGRVGVARTRPTRAQLKRNMYQHGFSAGLRNGSSIADHMKEHRDREIEFLKTLLRLKSAGAIHDKIREHLA